jgi:amino acid adenylation domain-containing protein
LLLDAFLEQSAKYDPEKSAVICENDRISYRELDLFSNRLGNALLDQGILRHDRIAIFLDNSIEAVISIFAISKCGATFSVLDPQIKTGKLAFILRDCDSRAIITDVSHWPIVSCALMSCPNLKLVILKDSENGIAVSKTIRGTVAMSFQETIEKQRNDRPPKRGIDIDLASIIYTSGSTGEPKGVMLTHLNMVSAVNSITEYLENSREDIILDALPLSFDYGLYQILMSCKFGGTVILEKSFTYPFKIIETIINNKVTGFPIVPTVAALLLRLRNTGGYDFNSLRYITSTGQALPVPHLMRLHKLFPKTKIFSMYGLTECKRVSYLPPEELEKRPSSVGIPIPNTEVYLVDSSDDIITTPWKTGELVVRGSTVMRGYWKRPSETAKAIRPGLYPGENVLYTGDLFKQDEDSFLYFVGRKDQMFKSGGEMVSPKEIENVLCSCPGVTEAAVIGVPDEILGQAIKAYLVIEKDRVISENEVIRFCSSQLKGSMIPRYIEFRLDLPRDVNGKVQKLTLKQESQDYEV